MNENIFRINDNELLYLIHQGSDEALELMFKKYTPLIKAKVKSFQISSSHRDDFIQEGYLMLNKAIKTYKEGSRKTFNKYFELIMVRKFISLTRKNYTYQKHAFLTEDVNENYQLLTLNEPTTELMEIDEGMFSKQEQLIYQYKYFNKMSTDEIASELKLSPKQIYNTTVRIKTKIKQRIKKN